MIIVYKNCQSAQDAQVMSSVIESHGGEVVSIIRNSRDNTTWRYQVWCRVTNTGLSAIIDNSYKQIKDKE